jgi:LysM repeat protein
MIAPMAARSPARFLAPLALLAFVLALYLVVGQPSGGTSSGGGTSGSQPAATPAATASASTKGPRFYRVKPGDTPSSIAVATKVPLARIQELNPNLDPQTLSPGQRIKLRP